MTVNRTCHLGYPTGMYIYIILYLYSLLGFLNLCWERHISSVFRRVGTPPRVGIRLHAALEGFNIAMDVWSQHDPSVDCAKQVDQLQAAWRPNEGETKRGGLWLAAKRGCLPPFGGWRPQTLSVGSWSVLGPHSYQHSTTNTQLSQ